MGERSAPIEGYGFAQSRPAQSSPAGAAGLVGTASLVKRAQCPHRGVWVKCPHKKLKMKTWRVKDITR